MLAARQCRRALGGRLAERLLSSWATLDVGSISPQQPAQAYNLGEGPVWLLLHVTRSPGAEQACFRALADLVQLSPALTFGRTGPALHTGA